jgi:hypothetical protein
MVPVGTELDEILSANVNVEFIGNTLGLTGKDTFEVSVAEGNDVSRPDLVIRSISAGDTHFFKLTKMSETKKPLADLKFQLKADYRIESISVASIISKKTLLSDLEATRSEIVVKTLGYPADSSISLNIVSKKDQFLGGLKKDYEHTFFANTIEVTPYAGGENLKVKLGSCLNKRPHEFTVSLVRDIRKMVGDGILNASTVEKSQKYLTTSFTKRMKLKGKKKEQCRD